MTILTNRRLSNFKLLPLALSILPLAVSANSNVVHDAEYYILEAQNGKVWEVEDKDLDAKLAELEKEYGTPPNIVHFMWDDQPMGAIGVPAIQQARGYETPNLNQMADEGMLFSRMYTEPSCTPTRAAALTGQHPIRNGMYRVGFPVEYHGISEESVTTANILSEAGYATGFFGKAHLGDIEESYMHNQGFDVAFAAIYNQVASIWNEQGEAANATLGFKESVLAPDPYHLDDTYMSDDIVLFYEGHKGEEAKEWCGVSLDCYNQFDKEAERRALQFIETNAAAKQPFYVAWWPQWVSFIPEQKKSSRQRGIVGDAYQNNLDPSAGALMETLKKAGIEENTLVIAMADNGPMTHNPPAGLGMGEGLFRGGKGDFTEGGVRVTAQAWWPGMIEPGQTVGDIIHVTDLYTTFARLGKATQNIPDDRVIDGIDQTSLLLNGDTHGRRDYVHIYSGDKLGATVKKHYKMHWINTDPTASSGIGSTYYDLLNDPREQSPLLVNMVMHGRSFTRMRERHEMMMEKYPNKKAGHGPAYTGMELLNPDTKKLSEPLIFIE
ncbi:sulfatase-like hydrolase/transferase [Vibrio comitans]|uniref:Sulfatase n=1 Tax=Vibrio comitans NBRC 102076 TaxID=1219078 RepID=A0A4Y3ILE8_9VIBR|nr:sulfatase-like hydrolase/transferase [Vibrio comitans]GEA60167.1 sulfatase [Vibrio comitans NBRC 102076]